MCGRDVRTQCFAMLWILHPSAVLCVFFPTLFGCVDPSPSKVLDRRPLTSWYSSTEGMTASDYWSTHRNFYYVADKDVAYAMYYSNAQDNEKTELEVVIDSIKLIQLEFGRAYFERKLKSPSFTEYRPKYLVIFIGRRPQEIRVTAVMQFSVAFRFPIDLEAGNLVRSIQIGEQETMDDVAKRVVSRFLGQSQ